MEEKFPMVSLIHDARAFLGLSIEEVQQILGPAANLEPDEDYQKLDNVTSIENLKVFPGTIYLGENKVELVYIGSRALMSSSRADLYAQFGDKAVRLRSRAGKRASLLVFAEQGIACSFQNEGLDFLEVFSPSTQRDYEARIFRDPGPFIR